jgi:gentisate 1,2-dioxygenase
MEEKVLLHWHKKAGLYEKNNLIISERDGPELRPCNRRSGRAYSPIIKLGYARTGLSIATMVATWV